MPVTSIEQTYWQGISHLTQETLYTFHGATTHQKQSLWYPPEQDTAYSEKTDDHDLALELRSLIHHSVQDRLTDARTAISLSGGTDSAAVWGTIRNLAKQGSNRANGVRPVSQLFTGLVTDERSAIEQHEAFHGIAVNKIDLSQTDILEEIPALADSMKFLVSANYFYYPAFFSFVARQGYTQLFTGFGGDNWLEPFLLNLEDQWRKHHHLTTIIQAFRGYEWTRDKSLKGSLRRAASLTFLAEGSPLRHLYSRLKPPAYPHYLHSRHHDLIDQARHCLTEHRAQHGLYRSALINELTSFNGQTIPQLQKLSASYGVTLQNPLMDKRLIEFAFRLPPERLSSNPPRPKWLFRKAMSDLLPPKIRDAPRKAELDATKLCTVSFARALGPVSEWRLTQLGIIDSAHVSEIVENAEKTTGILPYKYAELSAAEHFLRSAFP